MQEYISICIVLFIIILVIFLTVLFIKNYMRDIPEYYYNLNTIKDDEDIVIVTAHYNEDLEWLKQSKYPVIRCNKIGSKDSSFPPDSLCGNLENIGREASSFLTYIVKKYDSLPKYIAFIHGHEDSFHQHYPYGILKAIENAKKESYNFVSLNNELQYIKIEGAEFERNKPSHIEMINDVAHLFLRDIWESHYEPELGYPFPEAMRYERSAQFIVSRDTIRKRSKQFYENLLKVVTDPSKNDYVAACAVEFSWHMIFGDKPDMCDTDENDMLYTNCNDETYIKTRYHDTII